MSGHALTSTDWDHLADTFEDEVCDLVATDCDGVIANLVETIPVPPQSTLVDMGCGIGTFVRAYGSRFSRIFAVEHAPRLLRRARRRQRESVRQKTRWMCADLAEAAADIGAEAALTVCLNVITSPNAEVREQQWEGLASVTAVGGHVLVGVPSIESARMIRRNFEEPSSRRWRGGLVQRAEATQKHYSRAEVAAELRARRLRPVKLVRAYVPWEEEGLTAPADAPGIRGPWDWIGLARRTA